MTVTVITGEGKGKTTGAIGLALRALGEGKKVAVIQFLKGNGYAGELFAAQRAGMKVVQFGWGCPWSSMIRNGSMKCLGCGECFKQNRDQVNSFAPKALNYARNLADSGQCDLLVLDEISHALRRNLLQPSEVLDLLGDYRGVVGFVLTGRMMSEEIIALADFAYEIKDTKHPFKSGIGSRRGIEY